MTESEFDKRVSEVRSFTRFYTRKAGVLKESLLDSKFGLTEARIVYELANRSVVSAKDLAADLDLDPGYLSRTLKKFENQGLILKEVSASDGRQFNLKLTVAGRAEFAVLNSRSAVLFGNILKGLNGVEQAKLLEAMRTIEGLLDEGRTAAAPYILRPHRPGDLGWVVSAHGRIYSEEFGWDDTFEALVADIAAAFLNNFDPKSECCWIAEKDGLNIGSAMVVRADEATAKLRLVIVDPAARGLGVGNRLVEECIRFARQKGYEKMTLWTNDNLHSAIKIYKGLGFELVEEEPHHSFGMDLVGQNWDLALK